MGASAGNIVIELTLDNQKFSAEVKSSGQILRQLQGTFEQTARSTKNLEAASESLSTKFRHLVMTMGNLRFVAMDLHDVFLRLPMAILKSAGELERFQAMMTGLSTQVSRDARELEGKNAFKFVTDMAQKSPFAINALAGAFVKLKSAGLDPTAGSLQILNDSVARFGGNSEVFEHATVAIQQMMGKGVVSMEELRQQLGEAVPTAMRDMATGMGLSMNELTKLVSKGTVQAEDALNKMFNIMALRNEGAAAEMMKTWTGTLARSSRRASSWPPRASRTPASWTR
jgi:tape measure domain-containing protein